MSFFFKRLAALRYTDLHIAAYEEQFANNRTPHLLVDVRQPVKYFSGHMPGAINIPLDELAERYHEIPRDQAVVVVCDSGGCSKMAADFLVERDYREVYNLVDGTFGWAARGLPLER